MKVANETHTHAADVTRGRTPTNRAPEGLQVIDDLGNDFYPALTLKVGAATDLGNDTIQIDSGGGGAGPGSGTPPWFDTTNPTYGATGDGTTDDTAAINLAIAALNAEGCGVLYFPCGTYKVTSALTTITAKCTIRGDGGNGDASTHIFGTPVSEIIQTSQTANLFTISSRGPTFHDISLGNSYAGSPSAGTGISLSDAYFARMTRVSVANFYDNISISDGAGWALTDSFIYDPVRYGLRIQGTVSPDSGDQSIIGSYFMSGVHNGTAAIRFESAGGLKVANTKINNRNAGAHFVDGIQVAIPTATNTSVLLIANSSIENVTGDAIDISTTGTATFGLITISGVEVGLYSNNSGRAVKVTAAAAGGFGTPGGITGILIDGLVARTDGTARAAVELTNTDVTTLGEMVLVGFNARYTSSGDTNTTDTATSSTLTIKDEGSSLATLATSLDFVGAGVVASGTGAAKTITIAGGASFATPAIVLGTAAAAGAAATVIRSDSTIVAFDATAPTDIPGPGVASAAGSVAFAARRDHKHALTYHDEPLTDGASNFIFDGGDIVVVTGVPN